MATEPLQPIKSSRSRKTPQPELPPQRSVRLTPKPETTQLQRSSRRTPATGGSKRRGRPARKAIVDEFEDISTSLVTQADGEGNTTKRRKTSKPQKERGDATMTAAEVQGEGLGATESALSAAPSTGVKKRKKRKSIGQQSTGRAKAAKSRSPLKPARQPRKRVPKPGFDGSLAKKKQEGPLIDAVLLDGSEPTRMPEVAEPLDSGIEFVEPSAEKLQQDNTQKPRKRKQVSVEELRKKCVKPGSTRTKRAPKDSQTKIEIIPAKDTLEAIQSMEKPAEVEPVSSGDVVEEQGAAAMKAAAPRHQRPEKRKRVTVGQQPKKRARASMTQAYRRPKAQGDPRPADSLEASQNTGKPAKVEADSMGYVAKEQEAAAEGVEPQPQKPKRKKRKSIGQQKPKKRSVDHATPKRTAGKPAASDQLATRDGLNNKPTAKRGRPRAKQPPEDGIKEPHVESLGHVSEEAEETQSSEPGLKSKPKARRGRPKTKPVSEDAVDELEQKAWRHAPEEEEEVQASVLPEKKKRGRPRKTNAAQPTSQTTRLTKASASRISKSKPAPTAPKTRAPPKNTIPITIYAPPSPTSSDVEEDPLSTSQPHTTTNTINAVDVLSQLCSELLSKSSSTLAEQARSDPSSTNRLNLKRTKQTTDLYAQALASRLLQLTTTLNTNTALQSRVRAAAKEERSLKKELKRLEKEKEDCRVRKEEVLKNRKRRELEELLSGIAGAVKRGWDMQKEGEEGDAVA